MGENIILHTENLTIKFGGLTAVNNVSVKLHEHEILGLIGTNGAGKTTLFNMIAGALKPTSGKIYYREKEIGGLPPYKICKLGIGRTYQIVQPFSNLTVLENVTVGGLNRRTSVQDARQKAEDILQQVDLIKYKDVRGSELGLPQLKRLEIARALATDPEILLLDEVMAGLNPTECEEAMQIIKRIRDNGMTIIVIEHVMKAIMNISDRIYVLNQGEIIAEGNAQEVSNNPLVIESYLGGAKRHAKN